jgi:protein gp37
MSIGTQIEWTDATWNPISGCTKISSGCDFCYAERIAERFRGTPGHPFENGFDLTLRPNKLREPLSWRTPRRVFVNSMSDLFHKEVPRSFLDTVFETMERANWHVFQILTKRSSLLRNYVNQRYASSQAPPHIWLGVSVEARDYLVRLAHLKQARAAVRFVSFEPLLEDLGTLDLGGIHWAIVGGESGPHARPMNPDWVRRLRDQCRAQEVAFFFKQWGGVRPKSGGNRLDGRQWLQYPLQVRRRTRANEKPTTSAARI